MLKLIIASVYEEFIWLELYQVFFFSSLNITQIGSLLLLTVSV